MHHPRLAHVILAAGNSTRFGGVKQLAKLDFKKSILETAIELALDVSPGEIIVVLGANKDKILAQCPLDKQYKRVRIVTNDYWHEGVGHSISQATHHVLDGGYDGVLIQLADQVAISSDQLKNMRSLWHTDASKIVAARYRNTLGAPTIFPASYFADLVALTGDNGAKGLIKSNIANVLPLDLEEAQWDIDTEQQLLNWQIDALET